jgi:ERCC4-related helicase
MDNMDDMDDMDDMDMDKDIIDELVNNIKKLSFFSDEHEYMKLYEVSLIEVEDIEYESDLWDILDSALKRYKKYLNNIEFMDETKNIEIMLKRYVNEYNNYKIDEYKLFKLMKIIDKGILDMIHSSKEVKFWL